MKTAVITGGNSGMGKATAKALAKKGFRVIIHGRDAEKTKAAAEEIKSAAGNTQIEYIIADLSLIRGMKALADAIKQKTSTIDVLALSAGVILPKQVTTADGLEAGFAIQYLSRFALAALLLPELKQSGGGRIIHIGAPTLRNAAIYFDDIAFKNGFSMMKALGQEMLANHLTVQEFAKRNPDNSVVMNILHVGIARTGIMREANFLFKLIVTLTGKSPDVACANAVYLATDPAANFSGYFLPKPGKPQVKEKIALNEATADRLWDMSMEMIKGIL